MKHVSKTTPQNIHNRAVRLVDHIRGNCAITMHEGGKVTYKSDASVDNACAEFDAMLDKLLAEDFFGTEGQNDPRGDRRE